MVNSSGHVFQFERNQIIEIRWFVGEQVNSPISYLRTRSGNEFYGYSRREYRGTMFSFHNKSVAGRENMSEIDF